MSADEMFEKLGFYMCSYTRFIEYFHNKNKIYICFDKKKKNVEVEGYEAKNKQLDVQLFNAIECKKKELGWI